MGVEDVKIIVLFIISVFMCIFHPPLSVVIKREKGLIGAHSLWGTGKTFVFNKNNL
jgi:hypothetical protein